MHTNAVTDVHIRYHTIPASQVWKDMIVYDNIYFGDAGTVDFLIGQL